MNQNDCLKIFSSHFKKYYEKLPAQQFPNLQKLKFKNFKSLTQIISDKEIPHFFPIFIDFVRKEIQNFKNEQKDCMFSKISKKGYNFWTIKRMIRAFNHLIIIHYDRKKQAIAPLSEDFIVLQTKNILLPKNIKTVYSKTVEEILNNSLCKEEDYLRKLEKLSIMTS